MKSPLNQLDLPLQRSDQDGDYSSYCRQLVNVRSDRPQISLEAAKICIQENVPPNMLKPKPDLEEACLDSG
jgi:hypothetical protein